MTVQATPPSRPRPPHAGLWQCPLPSQAPPLAPPRPRPRPARGVMAMPAPFQAPPLAPLAPLQPRALAPPCRDIPTSRCSAPQLSPVPAIPTSRCVSRCLSRHPDIPGSLPPLSRSRRVSLTRYPGVPACIAVSIAISRCVPGAYRGVCRDIPGSLSPLSLSRPFPLTAPAGPAPPLPPLPIGQRSFESHPPPSHWPALSESHLHHSPLVRATVSPEIIPPLPRLFI